MITISITGNLGADAIVKQVGDVDVAEFSIASTTMVKGEKVTQWARCAMWGSRGTNLAPYLTKGKNITVCGTLNARLYDKDGETRLSLDVRVNELAFGGGDSKGKDADEETDYPEGLDDSPKANAKGGSDRTPAAKPKGNLKPASNGSKHAARR